MSRGRPVRQLQTELAPHTQCSSKQLQDWPGMLQATPSFASLGQPTTPNTGVHAAALRSGGDIDIEESSPQPASAASASVSMRRRRFGMRPGYADVAAASVI